MRKKNTAVFMILIAMTALILSNYCLFSSDFLKCPKLGKEKRPALFYYEGAKDGLHAYIAYQQDGQLMREAVGSAQYFSGTQIDNAVFLIQRGLSTPEHAIDFDTGEQKPAAENGLAWCLRSEPSRKTSMLIYSPRGAGSDRLIEFSLTSLSVVKEQILSSKQLGDEYDRIEHPYKISPDFSKIAYFRQQNQREQFPRGDFELKMLDLKTYKAKILDENIRVKVSSFSSFEGRPPFEWISNDQVLYQDMIVPDKSNSYSTSGLCVFKIVDVNNGKISECFSQELRLELKGGTIKTDSLTGRLSFNRYYILDYLRKQIIDKNLPFVVSSTNTRTEISLNSEVVYSARTRPETCLSKSGLNLAYVIALGGISVPSEVYAVFNGSYKPVKIYEGSGQMSGLIGWIE